MKVQRKLLTIEQRHKICERHTIESIDHSFKCCMVWCPLRVRFNKQVYCFKDLGSMQILNAKAKNDPELLEAMHIYLNTEIEVKDENTEKIADRGTERKNL